MLKKVPTSLSNKKGLGKGTRKNEGGEGVKGVAAG